MVNLLKKEENKATSDEVYSVSYTYERGTQDIAQATGSTGVGLGNGFKELTEKLQLN
jgi:transcription initiation factor TFIIIB Brf1 subunit/transcription initiation factor TFIIB